MTVSQRGPGIAPGPRPRTASCTDPGAGFVERAPSGGTGRGADAQGVAMFDGQRDLDEIEVARRVEHRAVQASAAT